MVYSGLCSVTFRQLRPEEVVTIAKKAGLDGIEWGGDKHVPPGQPGLAEKVLHLTVDAGLKVAAYGSYYRVGESNEFRFEQVLQSAKALNAPVIRVWAGKLGSSEADNNYWQTVVDESRRIADAAKNENIQVAFEFHVNTLTDTNQSCFKLLDHINHENVKTYWQPSQNMSQEERVLGLKTVSPWLSNIHVFHWREGKKLPLAAGINEWKEYMSVTKDVQDDHYAMLEFVRDNSPEQFLEDASSLKRILAFE